VQAIAGIAFTLQLIAAWGVGIRLLRLSRRTGGLPEKLLGVMLLALMGIGYPMAIGAQAEASLGLFAAKCFQNLSNTLIDVGFAMIFLFTWKVFRAGSAWPRVLCVATVALLAFHVVGVAHTISSLESMGGAVEATRYWAVIPLGLGAGGFLWTGVESLRYHRLLIRRVALGLTGPLLANRFRLWGWMGLATALGAVANLGFLQAHIDVVSDPRALSVTCAVGLSQSVLLYLTFLPPRRYAAWIEGRTQATAEAA
jgi:hypothetical protein